MPNFDMPGYKSSQGLPKAEASGEINSPELKKSPAAHDSSVMSNIPGTTRATEATRPPKEKREREAFTAERIDEIKGTEEMLKTLARIEEMEKEAQRKQSERQARIAELERAINAIMNPEIELELDDIEIIEEFSKEDENFFNSQPGSFMEEIIKNDPLAEKARLRAEKTQNELGAMDKANLGWQKKMNEAYKAEETKEAAESHAYLKAFGTTLKKEVAQGKEISALNALEEKKKDELLNEISKYEKTADALSSKIMDMETRFDLVSSKKGFFNRLEKKSLEKKLKKLYSQKENLDMEMYARIKDEIGFPGIMDIQKKLAEEYGELVRDEDIVDVENIVEDDDIIESKAV